MKIIVTYLLVLLAALLFITYQLNIEHLPAQLVAYTVLCNSSLIGAIGGITYCLRAVYLNACVHNRWSDKWQPWYFVRPYVSLICGGVSYLFLKAGLLVLEAGERGGSSDLGFYALAFIAGLNVDKFLDKLQSIAQAAWGIDKSRTHSKED